MESGFFTNRSEVTFLDKLKSNIDSCSAFFFSVSFIKKPGLKLIAPNLEAALARGAWGKFITSTYQNFTDIDSLKYLHDLQSRYPEQFACRLDKECFHDFTGNTVGFHSKGYLFELRDHTELLVGSSNITLFALLKNIEWDVAVTGSKADDTTYAAAKREFETLWAQTCPLTQELIQEYKTRLYYSIERWDMDYCIANSAVKPNHMQRKALKELNRIRAMGAARALITASAGSGKTFLAAFDALNFNPQRLLYIVHESSILMKSYETFAAVFGSDKTYGLFNGDYKEQDADFVFSTNVTMANSLEMFKPNEWEYIVIDECHHATAATYRKIIDYFTPEFLLGITATPERMDGEDVYSLFDHNVPYELRLRDAIINQLVVPFHYYGIRDDLIEYDLKETKGHSFIEAFSQEDHCDFIRRMIEKHRLPNEKLKALAFCRDVSHAIRMAQAMEDYYKTRYLCGKNSVGERIQAYHDLQEESADLEILFTVDILNEGVDIPGVNMVLFLRPTDSQTIFIQQLGRGLRKKEGKEYVTVLDFIGNHYKRSVQIAFALGSMAKNFVVEKKLVAALVAEDFRSIGLAEHGVEIHLDDLSKKEILSYINDVNFNTRPFLQQDYQNFKKYIGSPSYPAHVDYLNNDCAPDLIRFMQSRLNGRKNTSYLGFLKAVGESDLPSFSERQEAFIDHVSAMLPIVRPEEYLIIQALLKAAGNATLDKIASHITNNTPRFREDQCKHARQLLLESGFFSLKGEILSFNNLTLDLDFVDFLQDLLEYGLGKYAVDFDFDASRSEAIFHLWSKYRKEQVQQLLLKNPRDIMKGTKFYDDRVYAYVTVIKSDSTDDNLKYADGYLDENTFQWESEAHISDNDLRKLKESREIHIFVRKVKDEGGITLPFTYIGKGHMKYVEGSKKPNGAHLFHIPMEVTAPEDIYFDFKLPG